MKFIAGIDPGTRKAVAVMDVNSSFYQVFSRRGVSLSDICQYLSGMGEPVIISTDVRKPPELVKKVASAFDATIYKPGRNMTASEKRAITKGMDYDNNHERDALASALRARKSFASTFRKIDSVLKRRGLYKNNIRGRVKELIVKKKVCNIEKAIERVVK